MDFTPSQMSSTISQGVEKVMAIRSNDKSGNAPTDQKAADLQRDTVNVHDEGHFSTTDYGIKVSTQDDWLKVVNEDRTGM